MITITAIFLVLNIFFLVPLFFIAMSNVFSDETLPYIRGFFLCLQILFISLFVRVFQMTALYFLPEYLLYIYGISYFTLFIVTIVIIKSKFDTTYLKAFLIQVSSIIFAIVIAFSYRTFVGQAFKIPAGSNKPTILIGDYILANKFIYRFQLPERNDFIIFKAPHDEKLDYIKRVVAIPHDVVEIVDKKVFINRQPIEEDFVLHVDDKILPRAKGPKGFRDNFGPVTVPKGSYFVLGDNRDNSYDSRFFGFVKKENIKGKAEIIYFSYNPETESIRTERIGKTIE